MNYADGNIVEVCNGDVPDVSSSATGNGCAGLRLNGAELAMLFDH